MVVERDYGGAGMADVPKSFARPALDSGALVPLLDERTPASPGLCLYCASHRQVPAPLAAFGAIVREATQSRL